LSAAALHLSARDRFQREPGTGKAFLWAFGMHLLLIAFLTVGLNWKSQTPAGLEAEIWDDVPVVKSVSQAVEQKMDADEKADIAMKKKKETEKKPDPKKELAKETKKVDPKELKKLKAEEEKQAKLKEAKLKEDKKKAQDKAKSEAERKEALAQDKARADSMARLRSAAGKEGAAGGRGGVVGDGVGGGGNAKPSYRDRVVKVLTPLINWSGDQSKAIKVSIKLSLAPDGTIISKEIAKSSGDVTWDKAVMSALDILGKMPKDESGKIPDRYINLNYTPQDLK
jgi:colicin import membrane protein